VTPRTIGNELGQRVVLVGERVRELMHERELLIGACAAFQNEKFLLVVVVECSRLLCEQIQRVLPEVEVWRNQPEHLQKLLFGANIARLDALLQAVVNVAAQLDLVDDGIRHGSAKIETADLLEAMFHLADFGEQRVLGSRWKEGEKQQTCEAAFHV